LSLAKGIKKYFQADYKGADYPVKDENNQFLLFNEPKLHYLTQVAGVAN